MEKRHCPSASSLLALLVVIASAPIGGAALAQPTLTTLHSFAAGSDGASPLAGLIADAAGNLYGTTDLGGSPGGGNGTVFKVTPSGTETVLYAFTGGSDGQFPRSSLIADKSGNLYGTTLYGGGCGYFGSGCGTVFKLTASATTPWRETVLYSFAGPPSDGMWPFGGGLIADASGNLYGTTINGGVDGTLFKLTASATTPWPETVLYSFAGPPGDGGGPIGVLIADTGGNFYGTTSDGGTDARGTVFKLATTGTETTLYNFTDGSDGGYPFAGLIADAAGNLYGTTEDGGFGNGVVGSCFYGSCGTVFKLATTGTETVLHAFTGGGDGVFPEAGLIADANGNLFGTTAGGSYCTNASCSSVTNNYGTVFKVTPSGTETVLYAFTGGVDGGFPVGGLIADANGNLFGTTEAGGISGYGTVFELAGSGFVPPVTFAGTPASPTPPPRSATPAWRICRTQLWPIVVGS